MILNNLDLNIWDKLGYETEYEQEGWVITPYTVERGDYFGTYRTGDELPNIELTKKDVERLTLGKSKDDGGDYTPDPDFWLDLESFNVIYKDIPRRVSRKLRQTLDRRGI